MSYPRVVGPADTVTPQISMLAEYSAMVAVPAFMYAGAGAGACRVVPRRGADRLFHKPAGNITLGGVPADVRQLIKNAVTQVAVQAVIDLVRPQALRAVRLRS